MHRAPAATIRDGTAAHYVTRAVPVATPGDRVGDIRRSLIGRRFDSAGDVAILDGTRLVGLVPIEDLLAADEDTPAATIMDGDPPVVAPGADQERVAWKAVGRGESSLAVADARGDFVGLIPPDRMLGVLLWEHDEDLARLAGVLRNTAAARSVSEERVLRRYWHRLPWLALGLLGALVATGVVGAFEAQLEQRLVLAFFLPGIVYMADAVGTQTETLVVRGLSIGVPIGRVLLRELATGCLVGVTVAAGFFPLALWLCGDAAVAVAVSVALLVACSTASLVGLVLPWVLARLGFDPAFGSGPVATVVQDILSIAIYLAVASVIVR